MDLIELDSIKDLFVFLESSRHVNLDTGKKLLYHLPHSNDIVHIGSSKYTVSQFINLLNEQQILAQIYKVKYTEVSHVSDVCEDDVSKFFELNFHRVVPVKVIFNYTYFKRLISNSMYKGFEDIKMITIGELCEILSISRQTALSMINEKKLPHYRINDQIKFKYWEVQEYINSCKVKE